MHKYTSISPHIHTDLVIRTSAVYLIIERKCTHVFFSFYTHPAVHGFPLTSQLPPTNLDSTNKSFIWRIRDVNAKDYRQLLHYHWLVETLLNGNTVIQLSLG